MPTAAEVMDRAAALLNDTNKTLYTYAAMLPYLNMAIDELLETMQQHNINTTNEVSAVIELDTGSVSLTLAQLPPDLIEIRNLYERDRDGLDTDWVLLEKRSFLRTNPVGNQLREWVFQDNEIRFIGALGNKDIKLEYIAKIQAPALNEDARINLLNSLTYLAAQTAGYCAEFIGENPTRASSLYGRASAALDRLLGINIKSNQGIVTRRRPFMAGYKMRGY